MNYFNKSSVEMKGQLTPDGADRVAQIDAWGSYCKWLHGAIALDRESVYFS